MRQTFACTCALLLVAGVAAAQDWAAHYARRVEAFRAENARLDPSRRHVVLVGDSLTEGWESRGRIRKFLPTIADRVLGRGISSDGLGVHARGLARRMGASIYDARPSHVVLLLGVNDIGRDGSGVAGAARVHERLVTEVRGRLPDVPLILVTLAPARGGYAALNPHVVRFNEHVRRVAHEQGCPLIDLHALVVDAQGELPAAMSTDGLHWTDAVYELLGREIERVVGGSGAGDAPAPRAPAPETATSGRARVTADVLNVRSGPGTDHAVVGTLARGAVVTIVGASGAWRQIRHEGGTAWVSGDYLAPLGGLSGGLDGD